MTGKTIALIIQNFVGKVMSLLFNMLSRFVIALFPRMKHLLLVSYLFAFSYFSWVLAAGLLEWFAIPSSSGPSFIRTLHYDLSILGGPACMTYSHIELHKLCHDKTVIHEGTSHTYLFFFTSFFSSRAYVYLIDAHGKVHAWIFLIWWDIWKFVLHLYFYLISFLVLPLSLWLLPKYRSHAGLFLVIIHYWRAPIHLGESFTTEWCWKGQRAEEWAGWRLQFWCIVSQCLLSSYAASSA